MDRRRSLFQHFPLMKLPLRLLALSALTSGFLMLPALASAHPVTVARADGSVQAVYSLRGRMMFINKVSRRNMRHQRFVERTQQEWLQKDFI